MRGRNGGGWWLWGGRNRFRAQMHCGWFVGVCRKPCALLFRFSHTASPQDTAIAIGSSSEEEEEGGAGLSGVRRGEAGAGAAAAGTRHSLRTTVVCLDEGGEVKDAQRFKVWGKCGGGVRGGGVRRWGEDAGRTTLQDVEEVWGVFEGDLMPSAVLYPPVLERCQVQLFTP